MQIISFKPAKMEEDLSVRRGHRSRCFRGSGQAEQKPLVMLLANQSAVFCACCIFYATCQSINHGGLKLCECSHVCQPSSQACGPSSTSEAVCSNPKWVSKTGRCSSRIHRSLRWFRRPGGPRTSRVLLFQDGRDVIEQGGEELRHAFVA